MTSFLLFLRYASPPWTIVKNDRTHVPLQGAFERNKLENSIWSIRFVVRKEKKSETIIERRKTINSIRRIDHMLRYTIHCGMRCAVNYERCVVRSRNVFNEWMDWMNYSPKEVCLSFNWRKKHFHYLLFIELNSLNTEWNAHAHTSTKVEFWSWIKKSM